MEPKKSEIYRDDKIVVHIHKDNAIYSIMVHKIIENKEQVPAAYFIGSNYITFKEK